MTSSTGQNGALIMSNVLLYNKRFIARTLMNIVPQKLVQNNILLMTIFNYICAITLYN